MLGHVVSGWGEVFQGYRTCPKAIILYLKVFKCIFFISCSTVQCSAALGGSLEVIF